MLAYRVPGSRLSLLAVSAAAVLMLETHLFAPLTVPQLDDRSYQTLVEEAASRIPAYAPEWTDLNESDPGATLLQLFDFLAENALGALGRELLGTAAELQISGRLTEDELLHAVAAAIVDGALHLKPDAPPEWADRTRIGDRDVARIIGRLRSEVPLGSPFRRGDANADGEVDIADAVWILAGLFLGGPTLPCPDASDANDNGEVELGDALRILQFQFLGGPSPLPPTLACGGDPTPDRLGCDAFAPCS